MQQTLAPAPTVDHVVWDWNGTLWDDLPQVHRAVNAALRTVDGPFLTRPDYVAMFQRPLPRFYHRVLGREPSREEMGGLNEAFAVSYDKNLRFAMLSVEAMTALEAVDRAGVTQSVLSMYPHRQLTSLVFRLGLERFFTRLEGRTGDPGESKVGRLGGHLRAAASGVPPGRVVLVGDTGDDMDTAQAAGAAGFIVCHYGHRIPAWQEAYADGLLDALHRVGIPTD